MRIVLVNWARLWDGAGSGGGVNGYCQSLALALQERGHEVVSLCGGRTYVPARAPEETWPCSIRRHDDWLGIRVFEVINSPVLAPSIAQFQEPMGEVSSPVLEEEMGRFLGLIGPDVVHFHNIEGFSIGCVRRARDAGAKVFFSLHNYHTICPQVYLMQGHRRVCHDFDNGHNCSGCIPTEGPREERARLAEEYGAEKVLSDAETRAVRARESLAAEWGSFKHEFTWPVRVVQKARRLIELRAALRTLPAEDPGAPPGLEVRSRQDALSARPCLASTSMRTKGAPPPPKAAAAPLSPDSRGQTQGLLQEMAWKRPEIDMESAERRALVNLAVADPPSTKPLNDYGKRRTAMIGMLSGCDRVLAVSNFVRDKFVAMGVDPGVIQTMHIGTRINRVVARAQELAFDPPPFVPPGHDPTARTVRPVRVVFMGYNNYYKGMHVLVEALEMLTPEYMECIDLSIFALDGQSIEWMFRRMEPRLARLTFIPGYQYHDIPWMLGGKDLGVVSSVWWDNAPQTVFEFFACRVPVLGAAVGGIPDFVEEGVNGMLFRGNDPWDLARRLAEVIRAPWHLTEMRANVRPPKDIEENAKELEGLYLGGASRPRPGVVPAPGLEVQTSPRAGAGAVSS